MDPTPHTKNENESIAVDDTTVVPKPKRPLSAFNLFYRFKRQKVIALQQSNQDANKDDITNLVQAAPGLEDYSRGLATLPQEASPEEVHDLRRANIHKEMENNLAPRDDTRTRSHRTNKNGINGSMSFVELGKLMNTSWQDCDDFAKSVFRELAEEGRRDYRQRLEKYNAYLSSNPQAAAAEDAKKNVKKDKLSKKASLPSSLPGVELKRHVSGYSSSAMTNEEKSGHQSIKRHVSDTPSYGTSVPTGYGVYADDDEPKTDVSASSTYDTEEDLHASIKGLEDQLSSARLKLRVVELENRLARQKAVEDQLRAQIQLSSLKNCHVSRQPPSARDLQRDTDGLLSLLNATRNDSYNPDSSQGNKKQRRHW